MKVGLNDPKTAYLNYTEFSNGALHTQSPMEAAARPQQLVREEASRTVSR